jgi:hypothetical protein
MAAKTGSSDTVLQSTIAMPVRSNHGVAPGDLGRRVMRSVHEAARDVARDIRKADAYMTSFIQRRKVEMLFAHLKRYIGVPMMRLRGPKGAYERFQLAATAQNLRKLANWSRNQNQRHDSKTSTDFFATRQTLKHQLLQHYPDLADIGLRSTNSPMRPARDCRLRGLDVRGAGQSRPAPNLCDQTAKKKQHRRI